MYGFDMQKTKQVAKAYVKHKAKSALIKFLMSKPGLIIAGVLLLILLILGSIQAFIEAGEISNRLDDEHNQKLQKEVVDIAREKSGSLLDYYGTDEDLALNAAWILSYYKYLQFMNKADITEAKDFDEVAKEMAKQGIKSAVNQILPQWYIYRKIKGELSDLAERMKPRFLYIKTERKTVTTKFLHYSMPRTYSYTVSKEVYNPETGKYETQTENKSKTVTVKWTEKVEITETQPIWLIVAADTIKQRYTFSYDINEYKRTYQNNVPQKTQKTKSQDLKLDFDPKKFIENKNCLHASELGIKSAFELKTNFDKAEKDQKPSTSSKTVETSPQTEEPPFSPESGATNVTSTNGEKKLDKEEILQVVETVPELSGQNPVGKEYERLEEMIKEDNPNEDIELAKSMIINTAMSFMKGTKDLNWVFSQINDYMNVGGYVSSSYIPAQFLPMFQEAEKLFGIPYWFLGAIAYRESSFNPQARTPNSDGAAVGLMQVQQKYWNSRVEAFKNAFPDVTITGDINNPRDQILIGSWTIYNCIKEMVGDPSSIDWQGDGWKEQVIPALAGYWIGVNGAKQWDAPNNYAKTRSEYAPSLLAQAQLYKSVGEMLANPEIAKPVGSDMNITSPFGMRYHPIYHTWKMHSGIDIATTYGQPVFAVKDSIVKFAGWMSGYGKVIILQSGEYEFYYAHLADIDVQVGQMVTKGQQIGGADSTGASTGNHLHFEIRINGTPVDPLSILGNLQ
ncbi:peptidoglycan DD-metalloendopeptidase family protein [Caldicellulosiruptor acetigenus]|uniref:peptidoglycan DD-metalloendopeptidase family protein n=1 Tax=Caldicellulosiruptor acetigenus TaxID=301953 RepID=UPI0022A9E231|nr:peptidoglycan DD-metalloendopeptidase family protein [Caldicellulosiruptor acetigenus]WAM36613.1 peptidoglycan DD-metalloendopeptidase family protein [Caldicellulosiruptor acetigenus]